jgi:virulence factor Mce-like protein
VSRRRTPRNPIPVAVALLVVVVIGSYLAVAKDIPLVNEPYVIKAAFKNSSGIKKGSPVRIAGVEVGRVQSVEPTTDGTRAAVLELALLDRGRPVKRDALAKIRPRIFLEGNFFVELSPGRPGTKELEDGGMIPASQTANPVQFDEVLKVLKSDLRKDLGTTFKELGRAQRGGGAKAFNRSLDDQAAAYRFSAIVSEALLGEKPGDLAKFLSAQGAVSEALDADPQALRDLVGEPELRGLTRDLRVATPQLASLSRTAVPLLGEFRAFASCANEVLVPFGNTKLEDPNFPATGPVFEEIPKSLVGLAGESRSFDANGSWFKVLGTGGPETVSLGNGLLGATTSSFQGVNPPPQVQRPPLRPETPCETQEPPDLRTIPGRAPQAMRIDRSSPKVVARTAKAQATAVELMRDQLKAEGSTLKVLDTPATKEQLLGGLRALKARSAGR